MADSEVRGSQEGHTDLPEIMVQALCDTYLDTIDRFDGMNEFRVSLRAALDVAPVDFLEALLAERRDA